MRGMLSLGWRTLMRPTLFRMDAEHAHERTMNWFASLTSSRTIRQTIQSLCQIRDERLRISRWGIEFPTPVGLAAGFDKNARWFNQLGDLGFGFIEVGTLTPKPQAGNDRPRLFRLPADRALLNRMGFNNDGAETAAANLARTSIEPILGINIGKNKTTPNEQAVDDYLVCLERLYSHAAYITVNISSPNTQGLRDLQEPTSLGNLLLQVKRKNSELAAGANISPKPVLLKIAPDLDYSQLEAIADLCLDFELAGIIATNTTISRDGLATPAAEVESLGSGGISGQPLTRRSRDVIAHLYRHTQGKIPLVGVGGIMNGDDAWEMFCAGASLVQVYTGFIYGGPLFVRQIHETLLRKLDERGCRSLEEIIGSASQGDGRFGNG